MHWAQKQQRSSPPTENIICSMVKNAGSRTAGLRMCIRCLQKWMVINSLRSLSNEEQKDLRKVLKNIKWESRDLPRCSCTSRIVRFLLKMYWAKLERDIGLHSTSSTSAV